MNPKPFQPPTLVLAESTACHSFSGRVLAAPTPSKDQIGEDTALTDPCFSQPGTGPMLLFTKLVPFLEDLHHHIIDRIT